MSSDKIPSIDSSKSALKRQRKVLKDKMKFGAGKTLLVTSPNPVPSSSMPIDISPSVHVTIPLTDAGSLEVLNTITVTSVVAQPSEVLPKVTKERDSDSAPDLTIPVSDVIPLKKISHKKVTVMSSELPPRKKRAIETVKRKTVPEKDVVIRTADTENIMTDELISQLSGHSIPTPEQPDDPIRQIIEEGVREHRSSIISAQLNVAFGSEFQKGGTSNTSNATLATTFSTIPSAPPVSEIPSQFIPIIDHGAHHNVVPPPVMTDTFPNPEITRDMTTPPSGAESTRSRSWSEYKAAGGVPATMDQMYKEFTEDKKKHDEAIIKLYKDLNAEGDRRNRTNERVDQVRKDFNGHLATISDHTRRLTNMDVRITADFDANNREFKRMKEQIDYLNGYILHHFNSAHAGPNQNDPQATTSHQMVASQTAPPQTAMISVPKESYYSMFTDGYEEALIKAARRGFLSAEILKDDSIVTPGFKRIAELRQAVVYEEPHSGPRYRRSNYDDIDRSSRY